MKPADFLKLIVDPTLQWLAPLVSIPVSDEARVLLMAIAGQESAWTDRLQGGGGPARGYWQFEGASGATGEVFPYIETVCAALDIGYTLDEVFDKLAWNDTLACSAARRLLWQDPAPLPPVDLIDNAWIYYTANWRPGAPSFERWQSVYPQSVSLVRSSTNARLYPDKIDELRSSKGIPL